MQKGRNWKNRFDAALRDSVMDAKKSVIPVERIEQLIFLIRGQKVMRDADLARIYGYHGEIKPAGQKESGSVS